MRQRTVSREIALKVLYAGDITKETMEETEEKYWLNNPGKSKSIKDFAQQLIRGVNSNYAEIDKVISACATNWNMDRMASIDRNILRIAVYELLHEESTPAKVVINEAIEMAKKYGDENSGRFVNGILDEIKKERERGQYGG
ncbi:MAG: transcription antitermination factor NusB [Candidatus Omnitrophota bacterium]|nr:transcription antitermination factor NusB [Candidatus Omnitrophota bacterium]